MSKDPFGEMLLFPPSCFFDQTVILAKEWKEKNICLIFIEQTNFYNTSCFCILVGFKIRNE